jgi:phosphohistidine phosphatase SixA
VAVHLVRHASAGTRDDFDPSDAERHLDDRGHRQAQAVADRLAPLGVTSIVSSTADRCIETMGPLATMAGLDVVVTHELFEGADTDAAWDLLVRAADRDGDAVFCSHGDVIPDLIRRAQLRGMEIPGKSGCGKGSCWTLSGWDGERFARGDYVKNPA